MSLSLALRRWHARIEAATNGYLPQLGWVETRAARRALDEQGQPIPWFTYPAIRFLGDRIDPDWRVLEFGAGMGTLWWSRHVRDVVAIEHSTAWAAEIAAKSPAKVVPAGDGTAEEYLRGARGTGPYDVVIVDGLYRNECLVAAADLVADAGVIILDDAQREEYRPGVAAILARGYRLLELHGPQPVSKHPGCTAILYRDRNVLGL